jgi:type IV pilus assembly protein PilW
MSRVGMRGFSLVELMVAMTLSLILLAGALSVLYTSRISYFQNERLAGLQESGRTAVELMLRDMRSGGFKGCTQYTPSFANALSNPTGLLWNFGAPVQGFESTGSATWSPTVDAAIVSPMSGSDILAVRTTMLGSPAFSLNASMATTTSDLAVDRLAGDTLDAGQTVMVSDCSSASVFSVTSFDGVGTTATIKHNESDLQIAYPAGAQVEPVDTVIYYIRESGTVRNGGVHNPALWRKIGNGDAQEIVEGVESMQVLYGVDTDGDRLVNSYQKASAVTNWSNVISVSIAMLIRSLEPNADKPDKRSYTLLDKVVPAANDRYERTIYTTTVALRNNTL